MYILVCYCCCCRLKKNCCVWFARFAHTRWVAETTHGDPIVENRKALTVAGSRWWQT